MTGGRDELDRARRQAEALAEQVKLLLKTEQRLSATQRALEEQVRRIEIVNELSLSTARSGDAAHVLDRALASLLTAFPHELAVAFVRGDAGLSPTAARDSAGPTSIVNAAPAVSPDLVPSAPLTADDSGAWLAAVDRSLGTATIDPRAPRRVLVLPIGDGAAVLVACTLGAPPSHARPLPGDEDRPFLELLARHMSVALEAVVLRRRTLESETLFQTGFAHASTGMCIVGFDGRLKRANAALCNMLGYGDEELIGLPVAAITHPVDRERSEEVMRRRDPEPAHLELEKRCLRKDGTSFWARVAASRVDPTPHREGYWFAQITDVTARRTLEETERMAIVGRLAAGVAHEINNPLTYVLFELESLERAGLRERAARSVENALAGSKRIARIVRDLKTFARHGDDDTVEAVDLSRVIEVVLAMCNAEIRHRAHVELELEPGTFVRATEARIAQVLLNLVINAAHAIGDGDVKRDTISVRTLVDDADAVVTVSDTGVGIPPEDQRRIFEPFFTTKAPGVGSGLGLSISASIVESYGGSLTVASEVGKGSTFTLRLPRWLAAERVQSPIGQPAFARPGIRLLLVDDEPMVLRALAMMLQPEFDVVTAGGAAAARAELSHDARFDAVVCDLMMPGESGMELFEWLRASRPEVAARTIFVTGGAFTKRAQELVARVENPVLEKPIDLAKLRDAVANVLQGKRRRSAS
ncbi:MAG: PAS domain S-box protein [Deltaproteobacteria bacterium]|nr:PAS domain S-box protein [Deltaproteobacteria bacterium]